MLNKTTAFVAMALTIPLANIAQADDVEIYLTDMLDNTQVGYCIDVAKGKEENANPDDGLQGHTCYSNLGALGYDQTFTTEKFADNILYMKNFDVCVTLESVEAGSLLALTQCDGSDKQSFTFSGSGSISPTLAPDMCFTLAEETRSGRSDANQIKVLSLQACSDDASAYQDWSVRGMTE